MMRNSNMSAINSTNNISTPNGNESSTSNLFPSDSIFLVIQISILSLTFVLAIAYIVLILIQPTFRHNKLNWFTMNICLTSAWFCIVMLWLTIQQLIDVSYALSCRFQTFLAAMGACQLMYSHCVIAISRLFTIVYANKRFSRSNMCLWMCIISGWFVACLVALPYLFADGFNCRSSIQTTILSYYTLVTTLFLPITIITVCNIRTLLFVRNSSRRVHAEGNGGQVSHKRDIQLVKITIGTFVAFLTGWTPLFVTTLFYKTALIPAIVDDCFQVLLSLSILHGVILLISTNQPVRIFLKQLVVRRPEILQVNMKRTEHPPNVPHH